MAATDKILLDQKGNEVSRIKENAPDQFYVKHNKGNYTWTTTTTQNGKVKSVVSSQAVRVLSKESVTGEPRENTRNTKSGNLNGVGFNGTLNESFTPEKSKYAQNSKKTDVRNYRVVNKKISHGNIPDKAQANKSEQLIW